MNEPTTRSNGRRWSRRLALSLGALAVGLVAAELGFRALAPRLGVDPRPIEDLRDYVLRGRTGMYAPSPHTVFRLDSSYPFVNEHGFWDGEWKLERTPGVFRIACLGGSTTQGQEAPYPRLLERQLERLTGRDFEVMNCGVSFWTSAETVVAWFLLLRDYQPDLVIYHHAANDLRARLWPGLRSDYSHYRASWHAPSFSWPYRALVQRSDLFAWVAGTEVPDVSGFVDAPLEGYPASELPAGSEAPYVRNVLSIANDVVGHGGRFLVATIPLRPSDLRDKQLRVQVDGVLEMNQILRDLAAEHGFLVADPAAVCAREGDLGEGLFTDIVHMTPQGYGVKAGVIANAILASGVLADR